MKLNRFGPFLILIGAALLLYWVKTHQRGAVNRPQADTVVPVVPAADEGFSRQPDSIIYTRHARCRMACRHVTEAEVKEILATGRLNARKIEQDERGSTYPLEGRTSGDKQLRIVVAPKGRNLVLVTVIDLDTDWPCNCR